MTAYTGTCLILKKLLSRSSFYDIACFSVLASGPHLDETIISENIFRTCSIDAIIFNSKTRISPISKGFQKVQREVRCFPYVVRKMKTAINCPKIVAYRVKIVGPKIVAYRVKIVKFLYLEILLLFVKWLKNQDKCIKNALLHIQL